RWYDVDFPDVIALRQQLYPPRQGYQMIGSSVIDLAWLDGVPGGMPVIVVAEGLMMYVPEQEAAALLRRITQQFSAGQVAFDAYSGAMTRLLSRLARVGGAKVELVWGINDPRDLEKLVPGLRLVESVEFLTMPELVRRLSTNRLQTAMSDWMSRWSFY